MGYYVSVDTDHKILTIDDSLSPNKRDNFLIENYLKVGYTIRFKSEKRTQRALERAKAGPSKDEIEAALAEYEDLKNKYDEIKKGKGKNHGYFAAKSWFVKEAKAEIEKRKAK